MLAFHVSCQGRVRRRFAGAPIGRGKPPAAVADARPIPHCCPSIRDGGGAVSAAALATDRNGTAPPQGSPWGAVRLSGLLDAAAGRHGERAAFRDQPGREAWSGRPRLEWSYGLALTAVGRLAAAFARLGLPPGSPIGICLPNSSEAALTILAVERAGHRPCLLPAAWSEGEVAKAVEAAGVQAAVAFGTLAGENPAETLCRVAARHYGLRFLCAYGPGVPDGVIDLDRALLADEPGASPGSQDTGNLGSQDPGIVTFGRDGTGRPLHRTSASLVASAATVLIAAKVAPGDRILSLLAPDDLAGLATGLTAALVAGATFEAHGLFDAAALAAALEGGPTHLVAPGFIEGALASSGLAARLASTVLVHAAPIRFKAKAPLKENVVDVVAFDETALIARARDAAGRFAVSIGDDAPAHGLLQVRRDPDGTIRFAGPAAEVRPFVRGGTADASPLPEWPDSGFRADVFAGIVIGIS
jgi:mycobactin salicyl-AMP ligase